MPKSRTKLKLGLETKPPEEQFAAAKAWLAERRALLVLDDIWENDVKALVLGPPVLVALHVASAFAAVDFAGSFAGSNELLAERGAVDFPNLPSTMRLLRNIVTRWLNLRRAWCVCPRLWLAPTCCEASLIPEAARGLRLERLRNEVHDVPDLLRRAVIARPGQQRRLLNAMAVCAPEGFWLLLTRVPTRLV